MITPSAFLKKAGACDEWLARARGKTWEQMFAFIRRFHGEPPKCGRDPLVWMARNLDPAFWGRCPGCYPEDYACLLGLPLNAWTDAIRACVANGGPTDTRPW